MRLIVTQLLQFARPNEYAGYVEAVDAQRTLEDCLVLTGHLLARSRITIQRQYQATRTAGINRQELQQVLVNLMVNAIHAMPDGGTLSLSTSDWADAQGRPGVAIAVADTGPGLGVWISRSLVERYGGDITAGNRPAADGSGAVLRVLLLTDPEPAAPGQTVS